MGYMKWGSTFQENKSRRKKWNHNQKSHQSQRLAQQRLPNQCRLRPPSTPTPVRFLSNLSLHNAFDGNTFLIHSQYFINA
mmetsp:Transcript_5387/g.12710  ORF Transcript_5387/g.12710 Transcript_5387/m.12710 type:complete len:80 (+) Transcript_5387:185-424(+)